VTIGYRPNWTSRNANEEVRRVRPERIYEGSLLFVTDISSNNMDSKYKRRMGRQNDRRPSSKPAAALQLEAQDLEAEVDRLRHVALEPASVII
jgi:hypothetical protein